ncbi:MAG TPA: CehA/McbA family metallohydrolase [Caldilineaceae bacterium]|nr:CehA/McbA family metallohydrolase [Caldilineaceae bacterium]
MAKITGRIIDQRSGETIEARVQVLSSGGQFLHPPEAILKVGPGVPFFYCAGHFTLDAPRGLTQILVERGTEYVPTRLTLDVAKRGTTAIDITLERWSDLGERGWHPGNTHIHYDEKEQRPDERLRLDPRVEDLRMTAISILTRRDLPYASNKYPPGLLTDFTSAHHHVECGEESRHNQTPWEFGYGHIMMLRLREIVEPISRGILVDELDPDYPPLCYACDEAHRQGGIVIWCHNGQGMEAPVATALGKLDAFNLFDPYWMDPEYDLWYAMLNCGFKLPASTGSDWFVCSANRVYAYTGGPFHYDDWVSALQAGRTFITNGPALTLTVNEQLPGATIQTDVGSPLTVDVRWQSHYAVQRVELIWNGQVVETLQIPQGATVGALTAEVSARSDGWLAARLSSQVRDSFYQPLFAHTSPVYITTGIQAPEVADAARFFDQAIDGALNWVQQRGKFRNAQQRQEVLALFKEGQAVYQTLRSV